jgi:3-oxoacyl-[acyl-carrier protein] reductase
MVVGLSRELGCDVTDERSVKQSFQGLKIDNLINCAGIASMNLAALTPTETARRVVDVNFLGTFSVCREAVRRMKHGSRIVNFTTVAVPLNLPGEAIYAASKAAVESFTKILAKEVAHLGITVNAVGPNPIDTDLLRGVSSEKIDNLVKRQPIPRMGTMADVRNIVDFFLRPESDFISGQVIYLGGVS